MLEMPSERAAVLEKQPDLPRTEQAPRRWPAALSWPVGLLIVALAVIYLPLLREAMQIWKSDDAETYGFFILPIAAFLIWLQRGKLRDLPLRPSHAGVWLLAASLLLETAAYLLGIRWIPLLSLVPVLAGAVLAVAGVNWWRLLRFPILFLAFAAPIPTAVTLPISTAVQEISTKGVVGGLNLIGVPAIQNGFQIDTPTASVEVAKECSGFKKLTSFLVFATLLGYLGTLTWPKRLALVASAVLVAVVVNVARITALVMIGTSWGMEALHKAHDGAEYAVILVAFGLMMLIAKGLGWQNSQIESQS